MDRCCCDLFKVKVDGAIKELRLLQSLLDECFFDLDLKLSFCDKMDGIIISGILYTPGLAVPALIDLHESFLYTSFSNGTTRQYVIYILRQKTISSVQHSRDEPIPEKSRFADPIYRSRYKKIIGRLIGYGRYFCVKVE